LAASSSNIPHICVHMPFVHRFTTSSPLLWDPESLTSPSLQPMMSILRLYSVHNIHIYCEPNYHTILAVCNLYGCVHAWGGRKLTCKVVASSPCALTGNIIKTTRRQKMRLVILCTQISSKQCEAPLHCSLPRSSNPFGNCFSGQETMVGQNISRCHSGNGPPENTV
jgi:hypothetical protein